MILQEGKHLKEFYGLFRDILYFPDEKIVNIHFYVAFNNDFDFVFQKKYGIKDFR